jgi:hypothetical protein
MREEMESRNLQGVQEWGK